MRWTYGDAARPPVVVTPAPKWEDRHPGSYSSNVICACALHMSGLSPLHMRELIKRVLRMKYAPRALIHVQYIPRKYAVVLAQLNLALALR
jgi:hypothetical protein